MGKQCVVCKQPILDHERFDLTESGAVHEGTCKMYLKEHQAKLNEGTSSQQLADVELL